MSFSAKQKLKAIRREIKFRRRCYPSWVSKGTMAQVEADYQLAVFVAIESDYAAKVDEQIRIEEQRLL
jgi:hypothetical protein